MGGDQDLLEFGTIDVYYVVWDRPEGTYYLKDMTPDFDHLEWTRNKRVGFYFYTDKEIKKLVRVISKSRQGVSFESGEIDILDELDLDLP